MPAYFRFRIGPFVFSDRLGRTQAQKRAARKASAARAKQRHEYLEWKADSHAQARHWEDVAVVAARCPQNLRQLSKRDQRWARSREGTAAAQAVRDQDARQMSGS